MCSIIKDIFFNNGYCGEDIPASESSKKIFKRLEELEDKIKKYLPEGLHARQEFEQMLFCCKTGASKHMVEVMEYVYENFLVRGVYPEAIDYNRHTGK